MSINVWKIKVGDRINLRDTTQVFQVVRITSAADNGMLPSDGPILHAQLVDPWTNRPTPAHEANISLASWLNPAHRFTLVGPTLGLDVIHPAEGATS